MNLFWHLLNLDAKRLQQDKVFAWNPGNFLIGKLTKMMPHLHSFDVESFFHILLFLFAKQLTDWSARKIQNTRLLKKMLCSFSRVSK